MRSASLSEAGRLVELVGSRLCHDLANPLGAIANGVELLQMADGDGAELALVADSVAHAAARLRFLRVAYGAAAPGQMLGQDDCAAILADLYHGSRFAVRWEIEGARPRGEVKLAFLLLQCAESALPRGGTASVTQGPEGWRIAAEGARMKEEPALWALLSGGPLPEGLRPAEVQFALAPHAAAALGRRITATLGGSDIRLDF